eukprot:m.482262 g.482262  ORF g.482262 m.482262 type:complete len:282 (+) comp22483_c0_seq1:134-979(+)
MASSDIASPGGDVASINYIWLFVKIVALVTALICSFAVAGIIGEVGIKKFHDRCLLNAIVEEIDLIRCQPKCVQDGGVFKCEAISPDPGCFEASDGVQRCNTNVKKCFNDNPGSDGSSKCEAVVGMAVFSGVFAMVMIAYIVFRLCRKDKTHLKATWKSCTGSVTWTLLGFFMLVCGAIITDGFHKTCDGINKYKEYIGSCKDGAPGLNYVVGGGRVFPSFYTALLTAEVMAWIAMLAWLVIALGAGLRFYIMNRRFKYEKFGRPTPAPGDDLATPVLPES